MCPAELRAAAALDSAPISSSPPASASSAPMPPSMAPASLLDGPIDAASWGMSGPATVGTQLSDELSRMLALAEERVGSSFSPSSEPPSPEEEVDAVLPAELLAAAAAKR